MNRRRLLIIAAAVVLVAAVVVGIALSRGGGEVTASRSAGPTVAAPVLTETPAATTEPAPTVATPTAEPVTPEPVAPAPVAPAPAAPAPAADSSIDETTSIEVVVNKRRPLAGAADYVPADLVTVPGGEEMRAEAAAALASLFDAASAAGHGLIAQSGYRGYSVQSRIYNGYVASEGQAGADLTSARPGYSEHQTGLAMDILDDASGCGLEDRCLGDAPSGQWLASESWRFGFVLRYPDGETATTGYEYEPWHYRYIGVDAATRYHDSGARTLEGFWGLPAAPDYG